MTKKQVVSKEAIVESTSVAEPTQNTQGGRNYNRYFWKNIDRLWSADDYQNKRIDELEQKIAQLTVALTGGA